MSFRIPIFPHPVKRVVEEEAPAVLPDITLRTLPGYTGIETTVMKIGESEIKKIGSKDLLDEFRVNQDEIIVLVLSNHLSDSDNVLVGRLLERGQRFIVVRNQFDLVIKQLLADAGKPEKGGELYQEVIDDVVGDLIKEFEFTIQDCITRFKLQQVDRNEKYLEAVKKKKLVITTANEVNGPAGLVDLTNAIKLLDLEAEERRVFESFSESRILLHGDSIFSDVRKIIEDFLEEENTMERHGIAFEILQKLFEVKGFSVPPIINSAYLNEQFKRRRHEEYAEFEKRFLENKKLIKKCSDDSWWENTRVVVTAPALITIAESVTDVVVATTAFTISGIISGLTLATAGAAIGTGVGIPVGLSLAGAVVGINVATAYNLFWKNKKPNEVECKNMLSELVNFIYRQFIEIYQQAFDNKWTENRGEARIASRD